MLKLYFSTRNELVNTDGSKLTCIIHSLLRMTLLVIIVISAAFLPALASFSPVNALSGYPSMADSEILTDVIYDNGNVYRPISEGQFLQFTISAIDPDGNPLSYSASNLPEGASLNAETRTFSWTPRYDQAGVYVVRFEVSDGELTDYEDVTITVVQLYEDWDVNGDESANILDMILVGQQWDEAGLTGWIREDVNEDGTISVLDMIVIGQNWTE